jgi:DNA-dependent RNA polymerase auxiliary subunit epsilon
MERYETKIADGTVSVGSGDDWLTVGTLADVFDIVGGEEYTIEYDETKATAYDWLDTDEAGAMRFDVRETIDEMTYPAEFVEELADRSLDAGPDETYPERTRYFAELLVDIWDSKGNLDDREENPFA